jgi:hypothetical protein
MPETSRRREDCVVIISSVRSPNFSTIRSAIAGPTPGTRPEPK